MMSLVAAVSGCRTALMICPAGRPGSARLVKLQVRCDVHNDGTSPRSGLARVSGNRELSGAVDQHAPSPNCRSVNQQPIARREIDVPASPGTAWRLRLMFYTRSHSQPSLQAVIRRRFRRAVIKELASPHEEFAAVRPVQLPRSAARNHRRFCPASGISVSNSRWTENPRMGFA